MPTKGICLDCGQTTNKLVDFVFLLLQDAFRYPHQVTDLLFLELDVSVENSVVHLTFESKFQHLQITLVETVINALVPASRSMNVPDGDILWEELQNTAEFFFVGNNNEHQCTCWVQMTNGRVETLTIGHAISTPSYGSPVP
jgi:hypothetical protein